MEVDWESAANCSAGPVKKMALCVWLYMQQSQQAHRPTDYK
jgi:hypothetical protein